MISRQTFSGLVYYAKQLVHDIRTRQRILADRIALKTTAYTGSNTSKTLSGYATGELSITFTPSATNNSYAELGMDISYSTSTLGDYAQVGIYSGTDTGANKQTWKVYVFNNDLSSGTVTISSSVTSQSTGTLTQVWA